MSMSRIERIEEELRQQISLIVQQELRDPRIGFVTITSVEITRDLRDAKIYFTVMEAEKSLDYTRKGLDKAAGYVRKLIGQRMRIKFTPRISFVYDDSLARRGRIDDIIDRIHKERELP